MYQYSSAQTSTKAPYSRRDSLYVGREQWFQIYKAYKASHLSRSVFFNTKQTLLFPDMKGVGRTTFYDHVSRIDAMGESKFQSRLQSIRSNNDYWDKTYQAYLDSGTNVLMEYFTLLTQKGEINITYSTFRTYMKDAKQRHRAFAHAVSPMELHVPMEDFSEEEIPSEDLSDSRTASITVIDSFNDEEKAVSTKENTEAVLKPQTIKVEVKGIGCISFTSSEPEIAIAKLITQLKKGAL